MNLGTNETILINRIQKQFGSVLELHEMHKNNFQASINYYENMSKQFGSLLSSLNFQTIQSYKTHKLFSEPPGQLLNMIYQNIQEIQSEVSFVVIAKLKDLVASVNQNKTRFDKKAEKFVEDIKKLFSQYNDSRSSVKKKIDYTNTRKIVSEAYNIGNSLNTNFVKLINSLTEIQNEVINELKSAEEFLKVSISKENEIVVNSSKKFANGFPFSSTFPELSRDFKPEETITYLIDAISVTFLEIKCSFGPPHCSAEELAPQVWPREERVEFYARVWETYAPANDGEASVVKKETVRVLESGLLSYWLVQKLDGSSGYVPCIILEPVA